MDFLLIKKEGRLKKSLLQEYSSSFAVFSRRNQRKIAEVDNNDFYLSLYNSDNSKCHIKKFKNGDFIVVLGTLFYKNEFADNCLDALFNDFCERDKYLINNLIGNYCVIVFKDSELFIFNDYLGLLRVYYSDNFELVSSSFLAMSIAIKDKTLSHQEIYEYIIRGGMYGGQTIFKRIKLIPSSTLLNFTKEQIGERLDYVNTNPSIYSNYDEAVEYISEKLLSIFEIFGRKFGPSITMALTGGYDSRLNLACFKRIGISPEDMYVYGSDNESDVVIAKLIAQGEQLNLKHINKSNYPNVPLSSYNRIIQKNFFYFDGLGNVRTGIFDNGSDLYTRLERSENGRLQVNGGGGEIFRNYWNLNSSQKTALDFARHKYDIYNYKAYTELFNKHEYFENFSSKMIEAVDAESNKLTRKQMEMCYPLFRLRYAQSINNSNNIRISNALTPLIAPSLLFLSYEIPMNWKYNGKIEASLIKYINPQLARYNSNYGHNFIEEIPFGNKFRNFLNRNIPLVVRPYLRNLVSKKNQSELPYYLTNDYISQVVNLDSLLISDYVDIGLLNDPSRLSRSLTLEYLLNNI